jgi:hypothetical protein
MVFIVISPSILFDAIRTIERASLTRSSWG